MHIAFVLAVSVATIAAAAPRVVNHEHGSRGCDLASGSIRGTCQMRRADWVEEDGYTTLTHRYGEPATIQTNNLGDTVSTWTTDTSTVTLYETADSVRLDNRK